MERTMKLSPPGVDRKTVAATVSAPMAGWPESAWRRILGFVRTAWRHWRIRRRTRRQLVAVSRLPARYIRDIGCDPESVYYALKGTVDEVAPYRTRRD